MVRRQLDHVFAALARSSFRRRFSLGRRDIAYLNERGLEAVLGHAASFVAKRLAPAQPLKDGKQTPMRGHPVFTAQHATATCCRGCLAKWHAIPSDRQLDAEEQQYIVQVLGRWLEQFVDELPRSREPSLFD